MGKSIIATAAFLVLCGPVFAQTPDAQTPDTQTLDPALQFPGPANLTKTSRSSASFAMPTGRWSVTGLPSETIEGVVEQTAWQVDAPKLSSLALMQLLRKQLVATGFTPVFECETKTCGGFDFRFAIPVFPEPEMHVDLGDFRFMSMRRGEDALALLVSRSATKGFVQLTKALVRDEAVLPPQPTTPPPEPDLAPADDLMAKGGIVLEGLDFGTGAADLTEGRYDSLAALAEWLKANPDKTVALVGHTDASGGLDSNIAISRRRAASVRARLIEAYDIPARQIEAQGVGYLSPIASNLTEEGRQKNRRVEAVLTSAE